MYHEVLNNKHHPKAVVSAPAGTRLWLSQQSIKSQSSRRLPLKPSPNLTTRTMDESSPNRGSNGSWGADTQPVSQSAYEGYVQPSAEPSQGHVVAGASRQGLEWARVRGREAQPDEDSNGSGDSMHLQPDKPGSDTSHGDEDDDNTGQDMDCLITSPVATGVLNENNSPIPRTPAAYQGKRFDRGGASSTAITPMLPVNPFLRLGAPTRGVMSLSQVFRATQAVTPLNNKVFSDPMTDRPSPDIYNVRRSSPVALQTSPYLAAATSLRHSSSPPSAIDARSITSREMSTEPVQKGTSPSTKPDTGKSSEDELGHSLSQEIRKRKRKVMDDERTRAMLAKVKVSVTPRGMRSGKIRRGVYPSGVQSDQNQADLPSETAWTFRERLQTQGLGTGKHNIGHSIDLVDISDGSSVHHDKLSKKSLPSAALDIRNPPSSGSTIQLAVQGRTSARSRYHLREVGSPVAPMPDEEKEIINHEDVVVVKGTQTTNDTDITEVDTQLRLLAGQSHPTHHFDCIQSSTESIHSTSHIHSNVALHDSILESQGTGRINQDQEASHSQPNSVSKKVAPLARKQDQSSRGSGNTASTPQYAPDPTESTQSRPSSDTPNATDGLQRQPNLLVSSVQDENSTNRPANNATSISVPEKTMNRQRATKPKTKEVIRGRTIVPETSPAGGEQALHHNQPYNGERATSRSSSPTKPKLRHTATDAKSSLKLQGDSVSSKYSRKNKARSKKDKSRKASRAVEPAVVQTRPAVDQSTDQSELISLAGQSSDSAKDEVVGVEDAITNRKRNAENASSPGQIKKRQKGRQGVANTEIHPASPLIDVGNEQLSENNDSQHVDIELGLTGKASQQKKQPVGGLGKGRSPVGNAPKCLVQGSEENLPTSATGKVGKVSKGARAKPAKRRGRTKTNTPVEDGPRGPGEPRRNSSQSRGNTAAEQPTLDADVMYPNRVFALFKGSSLVYHPATCLSAVGEHEYRVRFDDGTIDVVDSQSVRSLDLRPEDSIKVEQPGLRTKMYIVCGFEDPALPHGVSGALLAASLHHGSEPSRQYPQTDIRGHLTVTLRSRQPECVQSPSTSGTGGFNVPVTCLYIVHSHWAHFKDRVYVHQMDFPFLSSKPQSMNRQVSHASTPSITERHKLARTLGHDTSGAPSPVSDKFRTGIFANMVFAVSYVDRDAERRRVSKHIQSNGGILLEEGFHELFDLDTPIGLPQGRTPFNGQEAQNGLRIKSQWANAGFACLIADQHSRKAKFMQALALGIPCLAGRWVEDCLRQRAIVPWDSYLLPSGGSGFLRGAIRSRTLPFVDPESALFSETIARGPKLLHQQSVLFLTGSGKAVERRKTFLFLVHALGASKVTPVPSLATAEALTAHAKAKDDPAWDYLYVEGRGRDGRGIIDTGSYSPRGGPPKRTKGSTNRPGSNRVKDEDRSVEDIVPRIKVIDDELLVQSLILGKLLLG